MGAPPYPLKKGIPSRGASPPPAAAGYPAAQGRVFEVVPAVVTFVGCADFAHIATSRCIYYSSSPPPFAGRRAIPAQLPPPPPSHLLPITIPNPSGPSPLPPPS